MKPIRSGPSDYDKLGGGLKKRPKGGMKRGIRNGGGIKGGPKGGGKKPLIVKKPEGDPIPLFKEPIEIEDVLFNLFEPDTGGLKKPVGH